MKIAKNNLKSLSIISIAILIGLSLIFSVTSFTLSYFFTNSETETNNSFYILRMGSINLKLNKQYLGFGTGDSYSLNSDEPTRVPSTYKVNGTTIELNDAEAFKWFRIQVNSNNNFEGYTINLNVNIVIDDGVTFTPIGMPVGNYTGNVFKGTFNGNGHVISNVYYEYSETTPLSTLKADAIGLFARIEGATINNLGVVLRGGNLNKTRETYLGGLVGYMYNSTLSNCFARRENINSRVDLISTGVTYAGGLVGYSSANSSTVKNTITNCFSDTNLNIKNTSTTASTGQYVGGIVGYMYNTAISNSYSNSDIYLTYANASGNESYLGGIAGRNNTSYGSSSITNSFVVSENLTGRVIGDLVGYGSTAFVGTKCYANQDLVYTLSSNSNTKVDVENLKTLSFYLLSTNWSGGAWSMTNSIDNLSLYSFYVGSAINSGYPVQSIFVGDIYNELNENRSFTIESLEKLALLGDVNYDLNIVATNFESVPAYFKFKVLFTLDGDVYTDGITISLGSETDNGVTYTYAKNNEGWYVYSSNQSGDLTETALEMEKTITLFTSFSISNDIIKNYNNAVFHLYILCYADVGRVG